MLKATLRSEPVESWLKAGPRRDTVSGVHREAHTLGGKKLFYLLWGTVPKLLKF